MMLPPRKAASCSYQPVNPATSNLSTIIFSQGLLNTLTPHEAWYLQPSVRDSPEIMDSTPLSNLAQLSHKAASPSCPIFPLLLLFSHRVILLQYCQQYQWNQQQFSKLCPRCWMLTSLPWPISCCRHPAAEVILRENYLTWANNGDQEFPGEPPASPGCPSATPNPPPLACGTRSLSGDLASRQSCPDITVSPAYKQSDKKLAGSS